MRSQYASRHLFSQSNHPVQFYGQMDVDFIGLDVQVDLNHFDAEISQFKFHDN